MLKCNVCEEPVKLYIYKVMDEYRCWKCNKGMRILLIYKPDVKDFGRPSSEFAYSKPNTIIDLAKEYGIKMEERYAKSLAFPYIMHICPHCGSHQGDNYVVEDNYQLKNTVLAAKGYTQYCKKCDSLVKRLDLNHDPIKSDEDISINNQVEEVKLTDKPLEKKLAGYISIEEIKLNFMYAIKKAMAESNFFHKRYCVEGKICSKILKHSSGISFKINNNKSETLNIFAPDGCDVNSNLQEGNYVKVFGDIQLYENAFKNNFEFLQLKVYKILDNGISEDKKDKVLNDIRRKGLLNRKKKHISYWGIRKYKIALITSATSEAIADITSSLGSVSFFEIDVIPVNLYNVEQITNAIYSADRSNKYNSIVLARGGVDRLDIFDEYPILYALCRCNTLTVSAVGHASQTPLTNLAADIKEDTPSAAGKMFLYKYNEYLKNKNTIIISIIVLCIILAFSIIVQYLVK